MRYIYTIVIDKTAIKQILIVVILIFLYLPTQSQSCLPEGITFNTQSQIDNFPIIYPSCVHVV